MRVAGAQERRRPHTVYSMDRPGRPGGARTQGTGGPGFKEVRPLVTQQEDEELFMGFYHFPKLLPYTTACPHKRDRPLCQIGDI